MMTEELIGMIGGFLIIGMIGIYASFSKPKLQRK
jgi:hypothetical protein